MDGMGDLFKSLLPVVGPAMGGVGMVGNLLGSLQQANQLNKVKQIENMSPQALGGMVSKATQPLNAGLVQGVDNIVQADLASRGLAQAPGIFGAEEAQTLAPFYQQNQQTALALISQKLGIPLQTLAAMFGGRGMPMADISSIFKLLTGGPGGPGGPGGAPPWGAYPGGPYATPPFVGGQPSGIPGIYGGGGGGGVYGGGGMGDYYPSGMGDYTGASTPNLYQSFASDPGAFTGF